MSTKTVDLLKDRLAKEHYQKLAKIKNRALHEFIAEFIELCNPETVFVSDDSSRDIKHIREEAIGSGAEKKLAIDGHTIHFDGYRDQARDKKNTKFLLPKGVSLGPGINATEKEEGLSEIRAILKDIMKGRKLFICFFCLGPTNSEFSIPCIQMTDSSYVAHSETILYRPGYKEFLKLGNSSSFFRFVHSEGALDGVVSKDVDKRRVSIDSEGGIVYSVNTQYGGNTIGLKKLAMRLAIKKASKEKGWLTEHMFLMGVHGPGGRVTYFTGAFPSLCGKTSTSMLDGETIVGDDIAYLRRKENAIHAVNVEKGIFGIIQGINSKDDPLIWKALNTRGEVIFSNVLLTEENNVYWIEKDGKVPGRGFNHSGEWCPGKKDADGNPVTPSHKNARFTVEIKSLDNVDPELDNPDGVPVSGMIYGGRDSDTWVPVEEAFDWTHGIVTKGASLESETTAATLGAEGVRVFNPMANIDFLSIPLGEYIQSNLDFGAPLKKPPLIFSVNYFLKDKNGKYTNSKLDKKVWLKWMELRAHKDCGALKTPTGYIPAYKDLKRLFKEILGQDYSEEAYIEQFSIRVPENLSKIDRIEDIYRNKVADTPQTVSNVLEDQRKRLIAAQKEYGDNILPASFKSAK